MLMSVQEFRKKIERSPFSIGDLHQSFLEFDEALRNSPEIDEELDGYVIVCSNNLHMKVGLYYPDDLDEDMTFYACHAHELRTAISH